jgi:2-oxoglutarate dehydrogenase E1 component
MNPLDAVARANPEYVDALYREYLRDAASVDERWALFFAGYDFATRAAATGAVPAPRTGEPSAVLDLVHSYRELGHLTADLDPLGQSPRTHPLLRLEEFGFSEADLETPVRDTSWRGLESGTLRELLTALAETYAGTLAVEYLGIVDKEQRAWLQARMEPTRNRPHLLPAERVAILERCLAAEVLEQFLHTKYPGQKRFSLEGGEALIPLLDALVEEAAQDEVAEVVIGMPHRGRLNVLAHVLRKPYEMILSEFEGTRLPEDVAGDGDVKYHLGYSHDHRARGDRMIHLSLTPNPSHLEAVDPVVEGIVRAKQGYLGDAERRRVAPVLLHGDASIMGQGTVYETLALSRLAGFTTGGTVHVIVNNQIGFTTAPDDFLFTRYPSDVANMLRSPVFHVNGDDPEAAVQAARLAAAFRQTFGADVFIDFVCYRRHGHNEQDDPTFTQPVMYEQIRNHPSVVSLYTKRLADEGVVDEARIGRTREALKAALEAALAAARKLKPRQQVQALGGVWRGLTWAGEDWSASTAVDAERLRAVGDALARRPADFTAHRRLAKLMDERRERVVRGEAIDWGTAELLAYGTLLTDGIPVRLCGQDAARGTFSHRHGLLHDAQNGRTWIPLNHVTSGQAEIELVQSPLSEAAVLGFEYGVSSADPRRLVIWEAQFGDFANGAQIIIDEFIAAGESKWQRMSGLTLFLPHGYEGQGPDHSSARLERFLQLCAEDNMQVVNVTTPAQLFHLLRRQMHRSFRKPLVVMSPKSLLRHPRAVSPLGAFTAGGFTSVLDDALPDPGRVKRVLVCAGKVFYALSAARETSPRQDTAIVRVEQLYPFPDPELTAALARYPGARDVRWVQEEPANQGAWSFARPRLERVLPRRASLTYVGRGEAASPATGSHAAHQAEEEALVAAALAPPEGKAP